MMMVPAVELTFYMRTFHFALAVSGLLFVPFFYTHTINIKRVERCMACGGMIMTSSTLSARQQLFENGAHSMKGRGGDILTNCRAQLCLD